ncbi:MULTISPECIES: hypothetical protein [Petrotoga]|uniref:Uncharacterized protein n=2 Tax=Petrotoga sibirica TaxID=156202 RepID=A0A855MLM5_9BACT|nr:MULTISPECIES: hypothetical protein [Petrotoga]POZ88892.1 hypothetical protein AA80_03175 [Petrotoga sibirica DSM 13575]POZ91129.1 hypothetical protein AD60_03995 [Petrotoga sp. SL27]
MRNSIAFTKGSKISIIIAIILIAMTTIGISKPIDDYIEFSPKGYEDISRIVTRNGTIINSTVSDNGEHLELNFKKDGGLYEVHVVHFKNPFALLNFWYSFVCDYSDGLTASFSAIPLIYGEYNGEHMDMYLSAWYRGVNNLFFAVYGPKRSVINDLKLQLNRW